jgi:hypothetical protein
MGSIFASKLSHATPATLQLHYAGALNELILIAACLALVTGVLSLALIRPQDFHAHARA